RPPRAPPSLAPRGLPCLDLGSFSLGAPRRAQARLWPAALLLPRKAGGRPRRGVQALGPRAAGAAVSRPRASLPRGAAPPRLLPRELRPPPRDLAAAAPVRRRGARLLDP